MCNFIIRPIKCYATVDVSLEKFEKTEDSDIKAGDALQVTTVCADGVVATDGNGTYFVIPVDVFTHTFSDKDPSKKESKDSAKTEKKS